MSPSSDRSARARAETSTMRSVGARTMDIARRRAARPFDVPLASSSSSSLETKRHTRARATIPETMASRRRPGIAINRRTSPPCDTTSSVAPASARAMGHAEGTAQCAMIRSNRSRRSSLTSRTAQTAAERIRGGKATRRASAPGEPKADIAPTRGVNTVTSSPAEASSSTSSRTKCPAQSSADEG